MEKDEEELPNIMLEEETEEDLKRERNSLIGWIAFFAVMVVLMAVCLLVIFLL